MKSATHGATTVEIVEHAGVSQVRIAQTTGRACYAHSAWWGDLGRAVAEFGAALNAEELRALKVLQQIAEARIALAQLMGGEDADLQA